MFSERIENNLCSWWFLCSCRDFCGSGSDSKLPGIIWTLVLQHQRDLRRRETEGERWHSTHRRRGHVNSLSQKEVFPMFPTAHERTIRSVSVSVLSPLWCSGWIKVWTGFCCRGWSGSPVWCRPSGPTSEPSSRTGRTSVPTRGQVQNTDSTNCWNVF